MSVLLRAAGLACGLALAACGQQTPQAGPAAVALCDALPPAEIERALGAPAEAATIAIDNGSPDEGCSWFANDPAGEPRTLSFTIYRKAALEGRGAPTSGRAFYDDEIGALRNKYTRVGALDQIGDEGQMGVGDSATPRRFSAEIVVIKREDVLSMRIEGEDPAAFEALARLAAQAM